MSRGGNVREIMDAIGPVGVKWRGARMSPAEPAVLSALCNTIFRQLPNGRFSPNLATPAPEFMSPQNESGVIFQNFPFRGHLLQKPQN